MTTRLVHCFSCLGTYEDSRDPAPTQCGMCGSRTIGVCVKPATLPLVRYEGLGYAAPQSDEDALAIAVHALHLVKTLSRTPGTDPIDIAQTALVTLRHRYPDA